RKPATQVSFKESQILVTTKKNNILSEENPRRGFSSIFRSAVTTTRSRSPNRQSLFEAARKPLACTHEAERSDATEGQEGGTKKNAIRGNSRLRASQRLACRLKRV
ncbi:MAG TPA: hypothetical protein VJY43_07085, partial [Methanocorpusculum sp.]|nr:hypothetical protein [Methanocorpusculum sp.]